MSNSKKQHKNKKQLRKSKPQKQANAKPAEPPALTEEELKQKAEYERKYQEEMEAAQALVMVEFTCNKTVKACEVVQYLPVVEDENGAPVGAGVICKHPSGDATYKFYVGDEMTARYEPVPGDFMVLYSDDYASFSPREAFLSGYYARTGLTPTSYLIQKAAKAAHEMNRAYCQAIGDDSQVAWEFASEAITDSAITGVMQLAVNPDLNSSELHDAWMKHKLDTGWRFGEEKCEEAKTHPCIKPYDELPEQQRVKDALFKQAVLAVLNGE